jgi:hypothetical protein
MMRHRFPLRFSRVDPSCTDQFDGTSVADHLIYSGVVMGSGGCSSFPNGAPASLESGLADNEESDSWRQVLDILNA